MLFTDCQMLFTVTGGKQPLSLDYDSIAQDEVRCVGGRSSRSGELDALRFIPKASTQLYQMASYVSFKLTTEYNGGHKELRC